MHLIGNPILLYAHHQFFADGLDAFNEIAEAINQIEPDIIWQSLGNIARHLYLQRIRDDGNFDIREFCKSIEIKNSHERNVTYFIRKEESFSPPIKQVTKNGKPYSGKKKEGNLSISIAIPEGESRLIDIEYESNARRTVGIILDRRYSAGYAELIPLEIDGAEIPFLPATTVTHRHPALVVPSAPLPERDEQGFLRLVLGYLRKARAGHSPAAGGGGTICL